MTEWNDTSMLVTPVDTDVLAALTSMQQQIERLTAAVAAQQDALDTLTAQRTR